MGESNNLQYQFPCEDHMKMVEFRGQTVEAIKNIKDSVEKIEKINKETADSIKKDINNLALTLEKHIHTNEQSLKKLDEKIDSNRLELEKELGKIRTTVARLNVIYGAINTAMVAGAVWFVRTGLFTIVSGLNK